MDLEKYINVPAFRFKGHARHCKSPSSALSSYLDQYLSNNRSILATPFPPPSSHDSNPRFLFPHASHFFVPPSPSPPPRYELPMSQRRHRFHSICSHLGSAQAVASDCGGKVYSFMIPAVVSKDGVCSRGVSLWMKRLSDWRLGMVRRG